VKQLFDITQVEDGASLAKVKNSANGLHYGFDVPVDQINQDWVESLKRAAEAVVERTRS
jgi:hypothetical protein